ncbi:GDSL-type esterase/lipase family protein [Geitlerinema sp. P-1104]|uniref:GDSL-type esterase/lipase family protein n=1 Tax=Geitlerinema sp. P-1104 TaxID=2546230 RepID=UPI001476E9FA|nr:GDSL-type esterase/lipase family protein [Geitlerinema sp. P-1104]
MRSPHWTPLSRLLAHLGPETISPRMLLYLSVASTGLILLISQSSAMLLNRSHREPYSPRQRPQLSHQPPATTPPLPSPQLPSPIAVLNLSRAERAILNDVGDRRWDGRQWYLEQSRALYSYLTPEHRQRRAVIATNSGYYPSKADYLSLKDSEYQQVLQQGQPIRRLILGSSIALGIPEELLQDQDINLGIPAAHLQDILNQVQGLDPRVEPQQIILFGTGTPELLKEDSIEEIQQDTLEVLEALRNTYPQVPITLVSVLPRSRRDELTQPHMVRVDNSQVRRLNRNLAHLLAQHPQIRFLDLSPYITDNKGYLKRVFSTDGLHANALTALVLIKLLDFNDSLNGIFSPSPVGP